MQKIKMVASDLDGTLLQYGKKEIEGEIFDQIRALFAHGIYFCPASGRQYTSLRKLFEPVAEDCVFLCENGAVIYRNDKVVAKTPMPHDVAVEIARDFWERSDGCGEVTLSGENTSYIMSRGLGVIRQVQFIGNQYAVIDDLASVTEEIVKVSVYIPGGAAPFADRFVSRWKDMNAAVAGPCWIDTTSANKGIGIDSICRALGFGPENVMAFGDNFNDVAMLDLVGKPYIMDGAVPALRARYPLHTARPEDALRTFLRELDEK